MEGWSFTIKLCPRRSVCKSGWFFPDLKREFGCGTMLEVGRGRFSGVCAGEIANDLFSLGMELAGAICGARVRAPSPAPGHGERVRTGR